MRLSRQILLIFALATLGAVLQGLLQGRPVTGQQADEWAISFEAATDLPEVLWVDSRPEDAYGDSRYPGALSLNEDNWDVQLGLFLEAWDGDQVIVVYCEGSSCGSSRSLAERLREELGIERVFWLVDGWDAILDAEVLP